MNKESHIIAIAGGTGSGKTFLVKNLIKKYGNKHLISIGVDSYYSNLSYMNFEERSKTNFDHPNAFDFNLLVQHLTKLKDGAITSIPIYNYRTHLRSNKARILNQHSKIILLEGIFALYSQNIRRLIDYGIFIDVNEKIRIERRINRDMKNRGRTYSSILEQYTNSVQPMFKQYIEPTKNHANLIIKKFDNSDTDYVKLLSIIDDLIK